MVEEYFVLLLAAANQGPAMEALLVLSLPLVGLMEPRAGSKGLLPEGS